MTTELSLPTWLPPITATPIQKELLALLEEDSSLRSSLDVTYEFLKSRNYTPRQASLLSSPVSSHALIGIALKETTSMKHLDILNSELQALLVSKTPILLTL